MQQSADAKVGVYRQFGTFENVNGKPHLGSTTGCSSRTGSRTGSSGIMGEGGHKPLPKSAGLRPWAYSLFRAYAPGSHNQIPELKSLNMAYDLNYYNEKVSLTNSILFYAISTTLTGAVFFLKMCRRNLDRDECIACLSTAGELHSYIDLPERLGCPASVAWNRK